MKNVFKAGLAALVFGLNGVCATEAIGATFRYTETTADGERLSVVFEGGMESEGSYKVTGLYEVALYEDVWLSSEEVVKTANPGFIYIKEGQNAAEWAVVHLEGVLKIQNINGRSSPTYNTQFANYERNFDEIRRIWSHEIDWVSEVTEWEINDGNGGEESESVPEPSLILGSLLAVAAGTKVLKRNG